MPFCRRVTSAEYPTKLISNRQRLNLLGGALVVPVSLLVAPVPQPGQWVDLGLAAVGLRRMLDFVRLVTPESDLRSCKSQ